MKEIIHLSQKNPGYIESIRDINELIKKKINKLLN